jgi:hypothetical protein
LTRAVNRPAWPDAAVQRRVERAVEAVLDGVAGQKPDIYRANLREIAAALRVEADEIEILADESD